jgi:hypothetical protein
MIHDVFVYLSRLGRVHGTKHETLALRDPQNDDMKKERGRQPALKRKCGMFAGRPHLC